jgi:EAL domain-containing protein (putative c-di-GMP-specific phosphodiesterase class I)/CheY-like chemotaxis protein
MMEETSNELPSEGIESGRQPYRMLVVDDDMQICQFVSRVAKDLGIEATLIIDSRDVVEADSRLRSDLIMLDLGMPGLDGVEVLRNLADARCKAAICLFSGACPEVMDGAVELGRELGLQMASPLPKPLNVGKITAVLREHKGEYEDTGPTASDLKEAIRMGRIRPHYQPKIELSSGRTIGVEALARWEDEKSGFIPPSIFIGLAEESGLIGALTACIAQRAFEDLSGLEGADGQELGLALNLSPLLLTDVRYPDRVRDWARAEGISPDRVTLEITESEAMKDRSRCLDTLVRFRLMGFHLSVDDFGTGFSSLSHLYSLPFEEIKIDRTFVADLGRKAGAETIVKSIIDLGKGLGLSVVAEGVEDAQTARMLVRLGCDVAQGYYFCRPQELDGLRSIIRKNEITPTFASTVPAMTPSSPSPRPRSSRRSGV